MDPSRFNPGTTELQLRRAHLLFREHQVMHVHVMEFTAALIAIILGTSCLIQVTTICIAIRMSATNPLSHTAFMIAASFLVAGATKGCLDFTIKYTKASRAFPTSFQAWSKTVRQNHDQVALQKSQRVEFRAYRPFYVKIGSFLHITETTFVVASSDVVLQSVWTLLLM